MKSATSAPADENIMQGYWKDQEETAKALKPWGLVTGDLGHRDEEGFIYLTGRKKDMLKIGGESVSPKRSRMPSWNPAWSTRLPSSAGPMNFFPRCR